MYNAAMSKSDATDPLSFPFPVSKNFFLKIQLSVTRSYLCRSSK
jgi:hypothetical protein